MHHLDARELAIEVGDFFLMRTTCDRFELLCDADCLLPVLFLLIDLEKEFERGFLMRASFELRKELLCTIEEPSLQIILRELEQRGALLLFAEI